MIKRPSGNRPFGLTVSIIKPNYGYGPNHKIIIMTRQADGGWIRTSDAWLLTVFLRPYDRSYQDGGNMFFWWAQPHPSLINYTAIIKKRQSEK